MFSRTMYEPSTLVISGRTGTATSSLILLKFVASWESAPPEPVEDREVREIAAGGSWRPPREGGGSCVAACTGMVSQAENRRL